MKVTIIICTNAPKRYNDTIDAIKSLISQTYTNIEIILIVDKIVELYNRFIADSFFANKNNIAISLSEMKGLSNARNKGVQLSTGKIIAFIDDDAIADPEWINKLIKNYSDSTIISVGGVMKPYWINGFAQWIPEEFYWTMGCSYKSQSQSKCYVRSNFGSNMSFRKEVFDSAGFFDTDYGLIGDIMRTGEETEFSIRALNIIKNSKIVFDPNCVVYHRIYHFRKSPIYILKRCYAYGIAIAKMEKSKVKIDCLIESTESSFFRYLLKFSFKERLSNIMHLHNFNKNTSNIIFLNIFTITVGVGFLLGKLNLMICDIKQKLQR
ncbi:MAG: glycosyltransferase [Acholeplasma sp.]|nr:glycosyltransferase [Acholeplasma sp.]